MESCSILPIKIESLGFPFHGSINKNTMEQASINTTSTPPKFNVGAQTKKSSLKSSLVKNLKNVQALCPSPPVLSRGTCATASPGSRLLSIQRGLPGLNKLPYNSVQCLRLMLSHLKEI